MSYPESSAVGQAKQHRKVNVVMFRITGVPASVTVAGSLANKENEIKGLTVQEVSIGLGRGAFNVMKQLTGACWAVISILGRKVWADDEGAYAEAADAIAANAVTLTPTGGQSGTSLTYDYGSLSNLPGGATGPTALAIKAVCDPKKPTYTIDGLVSALARELPDGKAPYVIIDQDNKTVKVGFNETSQLNANDAIISGVSPAPTNRAVIVLGALPETTGNSSLPFEGGNV